MPSKEYYKTHRETFLEQSRLYREKHKEYYRIKAREQHKKYDPICHKKYYDRNRDLIVTRMKAFYKTHPGYNSEQSRKYNGRTREQLFEILGNKCSNPNCLVPGGCTDIRCIQVDHINGGGLREIRRFKSANTMYRYYVKHLDELRNNFQLLCANCNWIKRYEMKEYITCAS